MLYSIKLKNYPIADLVILTSGFFIRVLYGSLVSDVPISGWLYLAVVSLSFFFALSKRRNEKRMCGDETREVLKNYSDGFLNQNMYLYLTLFIAFYAIWSMSDATSSIKIWTTPLVMILMIRYSYDIEKNVHGDPVGVILSDIMLWVIGAIYAAMMLLIVYFPEILK